MNTRISPNGQHANAGSNGNGASLLKVGEPGERTNRFMQEQPGQRSAEPIRGRSSGSSKFRNQLQLQFPPIEKDNERKPK
jgi:hypothetical protein